MIKSGKIKKAEKLISKGNYALAIEICRQLIKSNREQEKAKQILTKIYFSLYPIELALLYIQKEFAFNNIEKPVSNNRVNILRKNKSIKIILLISIISLSIFGISLGTIPVIFPGFSSEVAENLRQVLGPEPVADLESVSFSIQDNFNKVISNIGLTKQLNVEDNVTSVLRKQIETNDTSYIEKDNWLPILKNIQTPIIYFKEIKPDSTRQYANVYLVKIPIDYYNFKFINSGSIPDEEQNSKLVGAFNGGFRAIHGGFGIMENQKLIIKPKNKIGTFIIYKNGDVDIIKWSSGDFIDTNILSFRQNCPLIVENGNLAVISTKNQALWGFTIDNKEITWRSGLGITKDKKYLIYGFGKSLNVETLAKAFLKAGGYNVMQLDINYWWTKFVLYNMNDNPEAIKITEKVNVRKHEYLKGDNRDFFYFVKK